MKVLFLAYHFPPSSNSGAYRPMFFANHLAKRGVTVFILTGNQKGYLPAEKIDQNLTNLLEPQISIIHCSIWRFRDKLIKLKRRLSNYKLPFNINRKHQFSNEQHIIDKKDSLWKRLKDTITDLLAFPDQHVGWIPDCVRKGRTLIYREKPELIFATGGPWSSLVAGVILKRLTHTPLILDFRDPWVSNPYFSLTSFAVRRPSRMLERFVVNNADYIIANTDELKEDFLRRYESMKPASIISITNGFEDYLPIKEKKPGFQLTITHTGSLYFSRNPDNLINAVQHLIEENEIQSHELHLCLVGDMHLNKFDTLKIINNEQIRRVIEIIPCVTYQESFKYIEQADILLIIQPDFPLQIPRKLYEYMAARKPILCICEEDSATANLVNKLGIGYVSPNETIKITHTIKKIYELWKAGNLKQFDDNRYEPYKNEYITSRLYNIFVNCLPKTDNEQTTV